MQLAPVVGIAIVLFALSEILKQLKAFKEDPEKKAIIPYFCSLVGAAIAVGLYIYDCSLLGTENLLEAVLLGAVSGLVATGSFQIYRQFLNLIKTAETIQTEVTSAAHTQLSNQDLETLSDIASGLGNKISGSEKTE